MQILKIILLCSPFILPIHLICQVDQTPVNDSANKLPVYQLNKDVYINWPLHGFVYKRQGIFYQKVNLNYRILSKITALEPDSIKKQNLILNIKKAIKIEKKWGRIILPSVLLFSLGTGLLMKGVGDDEPNTLKSGVILMAAGTTGFFFAGIFNKKKKKANRVIVEILNN
jgi:hypothetical protein